MPVSRPANCTSIPWMIDYLVTRKSPCYKGAVSPAEEILTMIVCCPKCAGKLRLKPESAGKRVRCPKCSTAFLAGDDEDVDSEVSVAEAKRQQPPADDDDKVDRVRGGS